MTKNISLDNVMLKVQMRNRTEATITWEDRNAHALVVVTIDFAAGKITRAKQDAEIKSAEEE